MGASGKATVTKTGYKEYIKSPEWRRTRDRYWASKLSKECFGCGTPRHKGMHLHHRTYKNLGNERLMDLVPMCERCHQDVHDLHRSSPKWQKYGLWSATKAIRNRNMPKKPKQPKLPSAKKTLKEKKAAKLAKGNTK
jgi:5-methylcytosine-specific restriction endonuclease McrA